MNYLKRAVCIVILCFIFVSMRTHFRWAAARSTGISQTLNAEADDSDAAIQIESKPEDQIFIEKWSQSRAQNQEAQEEDPISAGHEGGITSIRTSQITLVKDNRSPQSKIIGEWIRANRLGIRSRQVTLTGRQGIARA